MVLLVFNSNQFFKVNSGKEWNTIELSVYIYKFTKNKYDNFIGEYIDRSPLIGPVGTMTWLDLFSVICMAEAGVKVTTI